MRISDWSSDVCSSDLITAPRMQGRIKADLMKIVSEQRGSSIAQFFTIEKMEIDTTNLRSEVTGELHTIVGNKVISSENRTFRYDWEYSGLSLKLIGFGMRSEEHTSELQSLMRISYAVFCLKTKNNTTN